MFLRRETPSDRMAIHAVHAAAFAREPGVEPPEARLVGSLREAGDLVLALSIVATLGPQTIGHVACSRADIDGVDALGLAPLGVLPAHQRRGVGTALMHAVLAAADALDEPVLGLLGDPAYYRRFGFVPGCEVGVRPPDPRWGEHFQIRTLSAWNASIQGTFRYAPAVAAIS
jgi:putative acetyltransferase